MSHLPRLILVCGSREGYFWVASDECFDVRIAPLWHTVFYEYFKRIPEEAGVSWWYSSMQKRFGICGVLQDIRKVWKKKA